MTLADNVSVEEAPVLSLRGLKKSYGRFTLGPMDVEIEPGYVVAVVGPNGSGKSTLFRLLMNLARPDAGELEVLGGRYPDDEVHIKRRIGYVPEVSVGHDEMTAADLGAFVSRWYSSWNDALYADLLRRFEIDPKVRFGKLSKGTQRRLDFSVAVACEPELLLLDEPTDGVDPFARRTMMEEISRHLASGEERVAPARTALFATHNIEEVRRIADYVVFLNGGDFLGLYEKDALLERWKTLWVERTPEPAGEIPGLVAVEGGRPARLITRSPRETHAALRERGVPVLRAAAVDLDEILAHLMRERTNLAGADD